MLTGVRCNQAKRLYSDRVLIGDGRSIAMGRRFVYHQTRDRLITLCPKQMPLLNVLKIKPFRPLQNIIIMIKMQNKA